VTHLTSLKSLTCRVLSPLQFNTLAAFGDFCAKTTGLHVALHAHNSGAESGKKLLKGLKDAAGLLVCIRKKCFGLGSGFFCK